MSGRQEQGRRALAESATAAWGTDEDTSGSGVLAFRFLADCACFSFSASTVWAFISCKASRWSWMSLYSALSTEPLEA